MADQRRCRRHDEARLQQPWRPDLAGPAGHRQDAVDQGPRQRRGAAPQRDQDRALDGPDNQLVQSAISHWIVELGGLDGSFRRGDIARLKSFITQETDWIRAPYAATESEFPRRTVFCATVNDAKYLVDPTGNSRFYTIPLVGVDFNHGIDMQQVFAQCAVLLEQGESWFLSPDESRAVNKGHQTVSAIQERVLTWVRVRMTGRGASGWP